jgi:hypothetical protein
VAQNGKSHQVAIAAKTLLGLKHQFVVFGLNDLFTFYWGDHFSGDCIL